MSRRCHLSKKKVPFAPQPMKYGVCPVCNEASVLTTHHIKKRVVFGFNHEVVLVCRDCHDRIDKSVRLFENEVLKRFSYCYVQIWRLYLRKGYVSDRKLRVMVRTQFLRINSNSFVFRETKPTSSSHKKGPKQKDEPAWIPKRKVRKKYRDLSDDLMKVYREGKCLICGSYTDLTMHHIRKRAVFGNNDYVGFPCRNCHDAIEKSVSFMEAEVLKKFECCYERIWDDYQHYGHIPDSRIRKLAKQHFLKVKKDMIGANKKHEVIMQKQVSMANAENELFVSNFNQNKTSVFI